MKDTFLPLTVSLLIVTLAGCSLLPPAGTPTPPASPEPNLPASGYEPQPGDAQLTRSQVFLDMEKSSLLSLQSYPLQVSVMLNGSLPDPCHKLRVLVSQSIADKQVSLEVYSLVDPAQACITVIQPFTATIPLGSYGGGHYRVYVNGELLGEFDA